MAEFKNQHYVQQSYLEGFKASNIPDKWKETDALWVLNKSTGDIRLKSIKKTASKNYYYSFIDKYGMKNPLIEKWFNPIENEFLGMRSQFRRHIAEINLTGKANNIDKRYRNLLAEYLYIHMVRIPKVFDKVKNEAILFHKGMSEKYNEPFDENAAQVTALRGLIRLGQSESLNIFNNLMKRKLYIEFFQRTKVSLSTSDSPVMLYDETRSPGLAYNSTKIYFTLDSSIILHFGEFGDDIAMVKHHEIKKSSEFNHLVGKLSENEVYCRDYNTLIEIGKKIRINTNIIERN